MLNGNANGKGLNGHLIDYDSLLLIKNNQERPLDKLSGIPVRKFKFDYLKKLSSQVLRRFEQETFSTT